MDGSDDPSTVKVDLLVDQVNALLTKFDEVLQRDAGNSNQTIIHRTEGVSPWAAAAVTACMLTFMGLILFALVVMPELHDLKAWSDVYRGGISNLEENVKVLKADKLNREHK